MFSTELFIISLIFSFFSFDKSSIVLPVVCAYCNSATAFNELVKLFNLFFSL